MKKQTKLIAAAITMSALSGSVWGEGTAYEFIEGEESSQMGFLVGEFDNEASTALSGIEEMFNFAASDADMVRAEFVVDAQLSIVDPEPFDSGMSFEVDGYSLPILLDVDHEAEVINFRIGEGSEESVARVDLSESTTFLVDLVFREIATGYQLDYSLSLGDGNEVNSGSYQSDISDFDATVSSGIDLYANSTTVENEYGNKTKINFMVSDVVALKVLPAPEPSAALLALLSLFLFGFRRKR